MHQVSARLRIVCSDADTNKFTGAGYRQLELLLGRIDSLSQKGDFTTQHGKYTGKGTIYKPRGIDRRSI